MKRVRKILLWLLGVVVAVAGLALGAFYLTPSEVITRFAADRVRAQTGGELSIQGKIKRSLYPRLAFETGPVTVTNPDWSEGQPLFTARSISLGVALRPLLQRRVVIDEILLDNPVARLEVDAEGRANFDLGGSAAAATGSAASEDGGGGPQGFSVSIDDARVSDGVFIYTDQRTGKSSHVVDIDLGLSFPGLDAPLTLSGEAVANTRRVRLAGVFDSPGALARGENLDADFIFEADGALIDFDGAVRLGRGQALREAKGALAFRLAEDPELTAWLRQFFPPRVDLIGAVDVAGSLEATPERLDLDLKGYADYNTVRTAVTATAVAGEGWLKGQTVADVELSALNDYFDVGYSGQAGRTPEGGLYLEGAYRAKIEDGDAFARWVDQTRSMDEDTLLESFDMTGDIAFLKDRAAASFTGVLDYNAKRVDATGELSGAEDWRAGGAVETYLSLKTGDLAEVNWTGDLAFTPQGPTVEGDLTIATVDISALRTWIDEQPTPSFYKVFALSGHVTGTQERVRLDEATIRLNDIQTEAVLEAELRETRPLLRAELSGGPFDLTPFLTAAPEPAPDARTQSFVTEDWSDKPFDFTSLSYADAELLVDIKGFRAAPLAFGPTRLNAVLRDGKAELTLQEMALYGGKVEGGATLDARGPTPVFAASAEGADVRMGSLLSAFDQPNLMYGDADFRLQTAGTGKSMKALMTDLNGQADMAIRDGALLVINFAKQSIEFEAGLLGAKQEMPGVTPFEATTASAVISEGVVRNRDMVMTGPVISVKGEGEVDLGRKRIDYVVTPTRFGEISILGIDRLIGSAFPVAARGPFSDIKIDVDRSNNLEEVVRESRRRNRDR